MLKQRELWGKRYNKLVNSLLRESVFEPLRTQAGWSPQAASFASFFVSGLLHMHVAYSAFRRKVVPSLAFFLLHGAACGLEDKIGWRKLPRPVGILLTQAFVIATAPLYASLFVGLDFQKGHIPRIKPPFELPLPSFTHVHVLV